MTLDTFISRLSDIKQRGARWAAICPSHDDRSPSLSISDGDKDIWIRCWAGCTVEEICRSLGLEPKDLFYDASLPRSQLKHVGMILNKSVWVEIPLTEQWLAAFRLVNKGGMPVVAELREEESGG